MLLSKRLSAIQTMIPKGSVVADVGSDHGKLIISLFENEIIAKGYAIENKKGPYQRLVKAIESKGLIDNVIPLFSDGISDLPECVDTIVIAGMGGKTIVDILKKNQHKLKNIKTIIVDAHNAVPYLREEISKMHYFIADENIVMEDNVYYEIIKFLSGEVAIYGEKDYEFGPILRASKSQTFKEKYQHRIIEIDNILKNNNLPQDRIESLLNEKKRIGDII